MNTTKTTILFALIIFLIGPELMAQGDGEPPTRKIWQLSGLIVSKENKEPVSYATVRINFSRRGIVSNGEGFYSIPVVETDTVFFMSLGYKTSYLIIKDYLEDYKGSLESPYIYTINYMEEDTINLPTVTIFPYDTPEKIKTAILAMNKPGDQPIDYAENNLDAEILDKLMKDIPLDDGERIMVGRQAYYQKHQQQSVMPVMPLFDLVSVFRLLSYINTKTKKKKDKNLNHWTE